MSSTKLELNALNKSDDITLYHDNFTAEKASQNNGTQDSLKYENNSDMSSQQSSDLHCQTLDKEETKQNNKGQLFKLMTSGEISDKFNEKQFEETKEKTGFFSNETSKESKPPVVLFTEIQKNENKNSFGKSDTESRNDLTEHDYPIHTTENNDQIIKQAESLHETLLLPNLDGQYIKPERSQIVDGPQVHFASPLFVYHEYTISECSSRTETMDSDSSMEIPELEIRSDESCTENKRRDINNAPITVLEESMELSTITHKSEEISDTSMKVSEDDVHSAMCSDKFENKSTGNTSVTISKHTVMPLIYSDKLSKGRVQVVPISSCENQMVNDSECLNLSNDSSQEDKIISEVRNILENLIVQCCDINDEFYKNDFEVKCTTEPNCTLAMLDVSFEENGLSQFSQYEKKELETFSDLNGQETRQVIAKDFTKFDIDELDETILLNSNQQQSSDDINFENSVLEELSSTANCKLVVIELKPSVNSETENNISQMGDLANISNIPNYSDKAKILKEENEEKVNKILSPKCLQSMCKIEESEIEMSSCDNQVTSTSSHSQQHDEEQSNSQFQVFDSENESTESQTEMNESCVHMEKIKPLNRLNDKTNSQKYILHENLDISEREASVDQCIINFDNPRKGDGDLNNNKSDVQELCTEAQKEGDNCYSISIKEVEQSNNVTMEIADASESLKIDHEQTCNGNDEHLDQKQNILKEFPVDFTDRKQKSDLIDDVRVDDTTSIEISTNVLKNYILDKDQESNVPITEIDIEFNDLSNSKNQQQEFNPCFESSESIVINKQLDLHLNAVMEDANLQVQESSSINQNDEESLIKVKENHLSLNYLQNSLTKGRLDRKRSVKETGIEDEKPSAKVSVYHSISEGLDQYKYAEVRLVDKEGIQHEDGTLPESVDIKITEELHYNDKIKECCAKEQMDQTVPDESDCGIKLATETLYSQHMDKKEDTDICTLEMKGDDISILPEMSGDYICREKYDFVDNSMVQAFKWKYVPSIDLDSVVPNCDGENEANPLLPAPIKTCKKPYRLGLSKRQKLSSLHPKLKRV
ncbi:uncharacterized protein LOC127731586 [Mytilus californianus]|uniref:uncharacterized protein LOC127731586 n=1 Tax=Mytilus californianus TaxID=6549 RepID=UPI00224765D9|nr:uncharacterized protein LOC127731586 [Mytilus californianus]